MTDFMTRVGIKNKLGLGCMRLPVTADKRVDDARFCEMIDYLMANGFNYFDTAPIYHGGDSEAAIGRCLAARYPRDKSAPYPIIFDTFFHGPHTMITREGKCFSQG